MYKLLLLDDEPIVLKGLKKLICWQEFGFNEVTPAETVQEALSLMQKKQYDVLISDIRLKGETGLDLLRILHEQRYPVMTIILSGYSNFEYIKEALNYGIENYLTKPIDEDELRRTLSQVVEKLDYRVRSDYFQHISKSIMLKNVLEMWVKGMLEPEQLLERLSFYSLDAEYKYYDVAIAFPDDEDAYRQKNNYQEMEHVIQTLIKRYKNSVQRVIAVWTVDKRLAIILCSNQPFTAYEFEKIVQEATQCCQENLSFSWQYTLGHRVSHISQIFESYLDCEREYTLRKRNDTRLHPVIRAIVNRINQNCASEYSLKTLANEYDLSQAYLGRLFKAGTGELFTDYLRNVRLETAKHLLLQTFDKTRDIALKVGFQNANYFSNVFMQHVGMYPSVYRKTYFSSNPEDRETEQTIQYKPEGGPA